MNKIELVHWDYTCGDGCCTDYGLKLVLNGEVLDSYFCNNTESGIKALLDKLNVEHTIETKYEE